MKRPQQQRHLLLKRLTNVYIPTVFPISEGKKIKLMLTLYQSRRRLHPSHKQGRHKCWKILQKGISINYKLRNWIFQNYEYFFRRFVISSIFMTITTHLNSKGGSCLWQIVILPVFSIFPQLWSSRCLRPSKISKQRGHQGSMDSLCFSRWCSTNAFFFKNVRGQFLQR